MSEIVLRAFDDFADATEATVLRLMEEIRALRAEVTELRAQARAAPEAVVGPAGPAGERGAPGADGQDGRGIDHAELRGGDLIFRLTDGSEINVGRVTGEQGPRGEPGERGADGAPGPQGETGPAGPQGERGADGIASEAQVREIAAEAVREAAALQMRDFYRGVYRQGEGYPQGSAATWDGSLWIALRDTTAKPGTDDSWQLAVKRGRDGRR